MSQSRPDVPALPSVRPRDTRRRGAWPAARSILALILREMSTRYGRSPGGYLWAVLDPLGTILLLALAFSLLMGAPALGTSFILFKATGMLPFTLYGNIWSSTSHALWFSKPLLMYPGVGWLDAVLARFLLNTLTTALVAVLILGGILIWTGGRLPDMGPVLLAMALAALLGLGVGLANTYPFMRWPAYEHSWNILNRPMFLASGILFVFEDLPRVVRDILWFNPLVHVTGLMRRGFYPMYDASFVSVPYVLLCALVPMVLGLLMLRRHHTDLLNL